MRLSFGAAPFFGSTIGSPVVYGAMRRSGVGREMVAKGLLLISWRRAAAFHPLPRLRGRAGRGKPHTHEPAASPSPPSPASGGGSACAEQDAIISPASAHRATSARPSSAARAP